MSHDLAHVFVFFTIGYECGFCARPFALKPCGSGRPLPGGRDGRRGRGRLCSVQTRPSFSFSFFHFLGPLCLFHLSVSFLDFLQQVFPSLYDSLSRVGISCDHAWIPRGSDQVRQSINQINSFNGMPTYIRRLLISEVSNLWSIGPPVTGITSWNVFVYCNGRKQPTLYAVHFFAAFSVVVVQAVTLIPG